MASSEKRSGAAKPNGSLTEVGRYSKVLRAATSVTSTCSAVSRRRARAPSRAPGPPPTIRTRFGRSEGMSGTYGRVRRAPSVRHCNGSVAFPQDGRGFRLAPDEAVIQRVAHELGAGGAAQLLLDMRPVRLDRAGGEEEL